MRPLPCARQASYTLGRGASQGKELSDTFREGPEDWRKRKSCGRGVEEGCSEYQLGGADLCGMVTEVTGAGITRVSTGTVELKGILTPQEPRGCKPSISPLG